MPRGARWLLVLLAPVLAQAHWTDHPELPDWAQRGRLNWGLHYSRATRPIVDLIASHHQTMIHGSTFDSPETAAYAASLGIHYMPYVCSRTFTLSEEEKAPQLREAMVLQPDRAELLAYGNPQRRYGSLFEPAWPAYVEARTRQAQGLYDARAVFYDNVWIHDDHRPAAIAAWQAGARQQDVDPGDDMPRLQGDDGSAASRAFNRERLVDYYRGLHAFNQQHDPPLPIAPNLGSLPGYGMAIVEGGGADLVFYETMSHPPFQHNAVRYKVGLAASHGRPTGILAYLPPDIGAQRGTKTWHEGMHHFFYPSSPLPEEFSLAVAEAMAAGGTYIPCYNLFPSLPITDLTDPFCRRIHHALKQSYDFVAACGTLNTDGQPASTIGLLYSSLTTLHDRRAQNLDALGDALTAAGLPYQVVNTEDLTQQGMGDVTTLIVPGLSYVDEATVEGLLAFQQAGGQVILTGPYAENDALGRPVAYPAAQTLTAPLRLASLPFRHWTLDGFAPETDVRLKTTQRPARATTQFAGAAGRYRAYFSMVDEDDGTSDWELRVGDRVIAEGQLDDEDNQLRWITTPPFDLQSGETLQLTVHADAGELGRIESFVLCAADPPATAAGAPGQVLWRPTGLETLPPAELAALLTAPARLPEPGHLAIDLQRSPAAGWEAIHLVNYDFRYEVEQPGLYATDDGSAEARVYFSGRPVVLRKHLRVPDPGQLGDPAIQVQVTSTADCEADLVLTLNGQPAGRLSMKQARGWVELPIDRALVATDNLIEARAEGDLSMDRWFQIGIDTHATTRGSEYSDDGGATFTTDDLSPDLKVQQGEFLIRLVDRHPHGLPDPDNQVTNGGLDAITVPHSETTLTVVPAGQVEVVVTGPPTPAVLLTPDAAPQWLTGTARGGETIYTVPAVRIQGIVLRHPDRAALEPFAAAVTAAAPWATPAPSEPLRAAAVGWDPYIEGFQLDQTVGRTRPGAIRVRNEAAGLQRGAMQTFEFGDQPPRRVNLSAWSRAADVDGAPGGDYSLYVDAELIDGSRFHGRHTPFATGSHDWQEAILQLDPPQPIQTLRLYLLFRNKTGEVWFDDVRMTTEAP